MTIVMKVMIQVKKIQYLMKKMMKKRKMNMYLHAIASKNQKGIDQNNNT